jgi:hypothetical protein
MDIPAGWYPDPAGDTTKIRYWNGTAWTDQTQPVVNPELQGGVGASPAASGANAQQIPATLQPIYAPGQEIPADRIASPTKDRKGFAIAALILGILSIPCGCLAYLAFLPGVLAIIFGILSLKSSRKGMAIAGIVCGALGIVFGIVMIGIALDLLQNPERYGLTQDYIDDLYSGTF